MWILLIKITNQILIDDVEKGNNDIKDKYKTDFIRYSIKKDDQFSEKLIDKKNFMLFTENNDEISHFKNRLKAYSKKRLERISIIGQNEFVGLMECSIQWPYSATTVTCLSNTATYYKVNKDDLFRRIELNDSSLIKLLKQKLMLMSKLSFINL